MKFEPHFSAHATGSATRESPEAFGLGLVAHIVARRSGLLIAAVAVAVLAAALYLAVTPPVYVSSAKLLIGADRSFGDPGEARASVDNAEVESQVEILRASAVAREVTTQLNLVADPDFGAADGPTRLQSWLDEAAQAMSGHPSIEDMLRSLSASLAREPARRSAEEEFNAAMASLSSHVGVRRLGQSNVVEIDVAANAPEKAARIARAVVAAYFSGVWRADAPANAYRRFNDDVYKTSLAVTDARVISAPITPLGKSSPQTPLIFAFAIAIGLFAGSALAVWLEARRMAGYGAASARAPRAYEEPEATGTIIG